ncbi:MAG: hypothetical protein O2857_17820 [Planctomycetota bacterium]|nr:hypothetical protein [Planctomycetota bacterium]
MEKSEYLRRNHWLGLIKQINDATQKRARLLPDSTDDWMSDKDKAANAERVNAVTKAIVESCKEMQGVESDGEPFGFSVLLDNAPSQPIRHLLAVLVARSLGRGASEQYMAVENYCEQIGAGDPAIALEVRNAFRSDTDIRHHITFKPGVTLEQSSNPRLRERSFNVVLGLAQDVQSEVIGEWLRGGNPMNDLVPASTDALEPIQPIAPFIQVKRSPKTRRAYRKEIKVSEMQNRNRGTKRSRDNVCPDRSS